MKDTLEFIVQYAPMLLDVIIRGVLIAMASLGIVYILGRMLGILKTYTTKNAVALMAMIGLSYWSILIYDCGVKDNPTEMFWKITLYVTVAAIFYVLVGFDLYDRFNTWSDTKFGHPKKHTGNVKKKGPKA